MIVTKEIKDTKTWDAFLQTHSEANFLQSWSWGVFHESLEHLIQRTAFYEGQKLLGVMLTVVEKAKRATYLTVPGGPIIDWNNKELVTSFKEAIITIAKNNSCAFVRVRPQLESNDFSKNIFKKLGFRTSPMHLHAELTNQLDIKKTEEDLLVHMRKATRYEIKKAQKLGVRVEESQDSVGIKKFYELQLDTAKRQGFVPFSFPFLEKQFKIFAEKNQAVLYSAYFEKQLLAQAFIIFYGSEAVYHYGASSIEGRNYPGAYLIQWNAILEAKKREMCIYNFWGVAKEEGHRFANLSMFKRGFGGEDFEYLHAQDLIINYPKYMLNYAVETIRKKTRHV